jgi:hypothetical protein
LKKKPKGAKLTKKQFAQANSDAMRDFTSKSPKGYATTFDAFYGYTADDDDVITISSQVKSGSKNKGSGKKWKKKKN